MSCDICGSKDKPLEALRDIYQTDDIKSVCPDCLTIANKELAKLNSWTYRVRNVLLKRVLAQRRKSLLGEVSLEDINAIKNMILSEREACAKIAEQYEPAEHCTGVRYASDDIRARGT